MTTRYFCSFILETDADPSSVLETLEDAALRIAAENDGYYQDDTASVSDTGKWPQPKAVSFVE